MPGQKKVLLKPGAREPFFGVKVGDLKKIVKTAKKDHPLYQTGNSDAMYLVGLIANEQEITKKELQRWAEQPYWYMLRDYIVAWIAAESPHGWELANEWIHTEQEFVLSAGWSTLSNWIALHPEEALDMVALDELRGQVEKEIHRAPNRVRHSMNGFPISPDSEGGCRDGSTACKVPLAEEYLKKWKAWVRLEKRKRWRVAKKIK